MKTIKSIFKNKEMRNRILFTLLILMIYRIGTAMPVPKVNASALMALSDNSMVSMINLFSGGSLEHFSVFAMGVSPYITASIIVQLLAMDVVPTWSEWSKDGANGKRKLEKATRYLAAVLALGEAFSLTYGFDKQYKILLSSGTATYLYVAVILMAGTMVLTWLGDQISQYGIGNGMSMIIFAGIASGLPATFTRTWSVFVKGSKSGAMISGITKFALYVVLYLAIIVLVVVVETAVRKVPIQYTRGYSADMPKFRQTTYLPIKVNSASVVPVIFAQSIMSAPQIIVSFFNHSLYVKMSKIFALTSWLGLAIYAVLIVLFTFFYTDLELDSQEMADNLKKSEAYIPGIRAGTDTQKYLAKIIHRITFIGAFMLMALAILPYLLTMFTSLTASEALGGTGVILIVGITLETVEQLRGMMQKDKYTGFFSYK